MIKRVYDTCKKTGYDTYVLTDSQEVADVIGKDAILDNSYYANNGTERCAAAVSKSVVLDEYKSFINVQGDMPDVTADMIEKCIFSLKHYNISTVFTDMPSHLQNDPNSVKMVRAGDSALWFGRGMVGYGYWHIGVYGYRRNAMEMYLTLPIELEEQVEELEQLRWLVSGWKIGCLKTQFNGIEINTPEDAKVWNCRN